MLIIFTVIKSKQHTKNDLTSNKTDIVDMLIKNYNYNVYILNLFIH